ncbi:MAG TPA: tetratricopeptide repeat protein [Polyangia bacterium]|nr:tetratricopeptide repeat protein [Polyangia bacterium]
MRRAGELAALVALFPLLSGFSVLEKRDPEIEAGNAALKAGKAEDALAHYDRAAKKLAADAGAHFDRGTALYALSRFDEAGQEFLKATEGKDAALKEGAFYNLGNAFFKKEKFKEAVAAYTRALGLRPDDKQAKWNLEIALRKQQEQDQKNKDQKNDQKNDDQKNKDDKDQKQSKNDQKKDDKSKPDEKKQDQAKNDHKNEQKPDEPKQQEPKPQPADERQQTEAVLDNLERSAKDLEKERARVRAVRRSPPERDW